MEVAVLDINAAELVNGHGVGCDGLCEVVMGGGKGGDGMGVGGEVVGGGKGVEKVG